MLMRIIKGILLVLGTVFLVLWIILSNIDSQDASFFLFIFVGILIIYMAIERPWKSRRNGSE